MEQKTRKITKHHFLAWGIGLAATALVAGLFVITNVAFHDRALPGSSLASINITGKNRAELTEMVKDVERNMKLQITVGDKTATAAAQDLGITVDVNRTVDNALNYEGKNLVASVNYLVKRPVRLVISRDDKKLQDYVNKTFIEQLAWVQDAGIQYDAGAHRFVATEPRPGTVLQLSDIKSAVTALIENPQAKKVTLKPVVVQPAISNQAAAEAANYMNARLGLRLNLMYKGRLIYYADPPDIAKWVAAQPNAITKKIDIRFSAEEIKNFLNNTVAPYIASVPVNEKVLVDTNGNILAVLTSGRGGYKIRDVSTTAQALATAVQNGTNINQELDIEEAGYGRVTVTAAKGEHWIEVNLTTQTTTAWTGSTAIASWRISSGTRATPTLPGEFRVWHKMRVQTMKGVIDGQAYNVPNVEWISYFDKDGRAFHATYWHNNFGTPMSHGCINMTYEAAEFVYNFAPIGTRVMVHY